MLRLFIAIAIALLNSATTLAQTAPPIRYVDLNAPGAMDKVQASNPAHYKKIQSILDGLNKRSAADARHWIRTTYNAKEVAYFSHVLVTYPGQSSLSFILDGTRYSGRVTLERKRAEIYPVKSP